MIFSLATLAFCGKTGLKRGIRGAIKVTKGARDMQLLRAERPFLVAPGTFEAHRVAKEQPRVLGMITHRGIDLPMADLKKVPGLAGLSAFLPERATVFLVTSEEGAILLRLIEAS